MSPLAPIIIVTGTGTGIGIGKTVTPAAIVVGLRAQGLRLVVVKPNRTGLLPGEPGDLHDICRLAGEVENHEFVRLPTRWHPMQPGAWRAWRYPPWRNTPRGWPRSQVATTSTSSSSREQAGCSRIDAEAATVADLGRELTDVGARVSYVVVAAADLGTLNHIALTAEALRSRGLDCLGFVIGSWPDDPNLAMRTNLQDLPSVTGAHLLGRIPAGTGQLGPVAYQTSAAGWVAIA